MTYLSDLGVSILVATEDGRIPVVAHYVSKRNPFCCHKTIGCNDDSLTYTVTHTETGYAACYNLKTKTAAMTLCRALWRLIPKEQRKTWRKKNTTRDVVLATLSADQHTNLESRCRTAYCQNA